MLKLTFGTYNVQHCADNTVPLGENGKPTVNVRKTAELLKKLNLDVVGLNEVYDKGISEEYCNQTEKIARYLETDGFVFGLGTEFIWKDVIGNAVISRYKILKTEIIPVPAPKEDERPIDEKEWFEDRVIVKTIIDVGREICFISTHFGLNASERKRMSDKLVEILDKTDLPCVLCGDFNALPNSDCLKPIYARMTSAADEFGKTDALTFPSYSPEITIDYIFFSKHFKILNFEVVDEILSDHKPLRAQAELDF